MERTLYPSFLQLSAQNTFLCFDFQLKPEAKNSPSKRIIPLIIYKGMVL